MLRFRLLLLMICFSVTATAGQISMEKYINLSTHLRLPYTLPIVIVFEDNQLKNMQGIFLTSNDAGANKIDEQKFLAFLEGSQTNEQQLDLAEFATYLPALKGEFEHLLNSDKKYKMIVIMPFFEVEVGQNNFLANDRKSQITELSDKNGQVELMFLDVSLTLQ